MTSAASACKSADAVPFDLPHPISRRAFLKAGLAAAVAGHSAEAATTPADVSFVVITDLHYRDQRCGAWTERVAAQIRAMRPRPAFVVLAGDISDEGTREQLGPVREILRPLPMPVHTLLGNHDVAPNGGRAGYESIFGTRHNSHFERAEYDFLLLNSTETRGVFRTWIPRETLEYTERTVPSLAKDRPLITITHFPLGTNWLRPRNADALLARLRQRPLQAVYSGHWHGISERTETGIHHSTGRCCSWWNTNHDGSELKGFTLCHARGGQVKHEFVPVPTRGIG